jgi:DNA-binding response OmpR family regulator
MRVLIVDDDPMVAQSCRRILAAEGIHLTVAGNAERAETLLASGDAYDLMLTDIKMPKRDGFDLTVRTKAAYPEMPVLMMTGYLTPETMERGRRSGVDGFIAKPFTPDELVAAVRNTVKKANFGRH